MSQHKVAKDDAFEPNRDHVLVGDPVKVLTIGTPKQNSKGRSKNNSDVTKNGRPKAFDEKTQRLCGLCRTKGHFKNNCPQNPEYVFSFVHLSYVLHLGVYEIFTNAHVFLCRNMA